MSDDVEALAELYRWARLGADRADADPADVAHVHRLASLILTALLAAAPAPTEGPFCGKCGCDQTGGHKVCWHHCPAVPAPTDHRLAPVADLADPNSYCVCGAGWDMLHARCGAAPAPTEADHA